MCPVTHAHWHAEIHRVSDLLPLKPTITEAGVPAISLEIFQEVVNNAFRNEIPDIIRVPGVERLERDSDNLILMIQCRATGGAGVDSCVNLNTQ